MLYRKINGSIRSNSSVHIFSLITIILCNIVCSILKYPVVIELVCMILQGEKL